jgi:hypothetical protein
MQEQGVSKEIIVEQREETCRSWKENRDLTILGRQRDGNSYQYNK